MDPLTERVVELLAPPLAFRYVQLLHATMHCEYRNRGVLERSRAAWGHYILAFWHSRFLMMPYSYPDRRLVVLLSRHRDARMLARVLRRFRLDVAFGSSSRGGAAVLREIVRRVEKGFDVGLAPDGPKGPRRRAKPGVLAIARLTGLPIIPTAFSAHPARRLRSWDRTLVPKLGAKALYQYGEPLTVPRNIDPVDQERIRRHLEAELDRLTDEADRTVGLSPEEA
jgi:hypothetical protein